MYFPWVGILEQIRLCDGFVFYDDVQYARGFFNRVQVKTSSGVRWMTVPLRELHRGQLINEVGIDDRVDWRRQHVSLLSQAYSKAPYRKEMIALVENVFSGAYGSLAALSRASTMALADYFGLADGKMFFDSSALASKGASTERLVSLCRTLNAGSYLTGHGARNYLDHEEFEKNGVDVFYIDYELIEYPQQNGPFTPYVTALDIAANCGKNGRELIKGRLAPWRGFIAAQNPES